MVKLRSEEITNYFIEKVVCRPGDVGKCAEPLVDMVILRIFDDSIGDNLLVAKYGFVVVVCGKITINHLCVISHSNL